MLNLNEVIDDIDRTLGRLQLTVDLARQLEEDGIIISVVKDWVNPARGTSNFIANRAIVPFVHALMKKIGLYENSLKNYVTAKVMPINNIDACIQQLQILEENMQTYSTRLYDLGSYDPTMLIRTLAWLARDLRFYARDAKAIMAFIPPFHQQTEITANILKERLDPFLKERRALGLQALNQERRQFEEKVKEEDRQSDASVTPSALNDQPEGLFSRVTSTFSSLVGSAGQFVGNLLTGTKRFFVRTEFNLRENSLNNLPQEGEKIVNNIAEQTRNEMNRGVENAQCIAISEAIDNITMQTIQFISQQMIQTAIYVFLYKFYDNLSDHNKSEVIEDRWDNGLYPLTLSMVITIIVSQIALRRWLNRREEREDFGSTPPSNEADMKSKFEELQINLGPHFTIRALHELSHVDMNSFSEYVRNNPRRHS